MTRYNDRIRYYKTRKMIGNTQIFISTLMLIMNLTVNFKLTHDNSYNGSDVINSTFINYVSGAATIRGLHNSLDASKNIKRLVKKN